MIFQRLHETFHFFWHHLTDLLWRLLPLLPLLVLVNYRFLSLHGGDPAKASTDLLLMLLQMLSGVLATGLAIRYTLAVIGKGDLGLVVLWREAIHRSLSLAAVQVLAGFAIVAGLFLLVLPGVYLMGVLLPAYVIVMAEGASATAALQAAWTRFRPQPWSVAVGLLVLVPALFVVLSGLDALGDLLGSAPLALKVVVLSLLDLVGLLFSQVVGILLVRVYELERQQAAGSR